MGKNVVRGVGVAALVCVAGVLGPQFVPQSSHASRSVAPSTLSVYVLPGPVAKNAGYIGPDAKYHDSIVPSTIVAKAGVPLQVTVYNYDDGMHSITSPALGLNVLLTGGKEAKSDSKATEATEFELGLGEKVDAGVTTFTITVKKPGTYYWYCAMPCDGQNQKWAMIGGPQNHGKPGYMGGYIVVV